MVSLVDLEVGIFVVDIVDLVLGVVDLEDGLVDIDVRSEKTYMIICHTKTKHEVQKEIAACKYLLESWFGHSELQNPYSPYIWIPVEGLFLVEHHLLIPVEKVAIAQPELKKKF